MQAIAKTPATTSRMRGQLPSRSDDSFIIPIQEVYSRVQRAIAPMGIIPAPPPRQYRRLFICNNRRINYAAARRGTSLPRSPNSGYKRSYCHGYGHCYRIHSRNHRSIAISAIFSATC